MSTQARNYSWKPSAQKDVRRLIGLTLGVFIRIGVVAVGPLMGLELELRPMAGTGISTSGTSGNIGRGMARQGGLRCLVALDSAWAVGGEGTVAVTGLPSGVGPATWTQTGVVGEWRPERLALASIGGGDYRVERPATSDHDRRHVAGLHVTLGLEPQKIWPSLIPLLAYRTDTVFTHSITSMRCIVIGLRAQF